jgi:hypothetical protein
MAQELRDLRAKVSVETDCALEAVCRATGQERSEVVRDVMHAWALKRIHESTLLLKRLQAEGLSAAAEGGSGRAGES